MKRHRWFKTPRPIELHWQDAHSIKEGWNTNAELNEFAKHEEWANCRTIGYIIGHSRHYWIVIGCNQNDGDFHSHVQRIPKGCVTWFRWLKPRKWQKPAKLQPLESK